MNDKYCRVDDFGYESAEGLYKIVPSNAFVVEASDYVCVWTSIEHVEIYLRNAVGPHWNSEIALSHVRHVLSALQYLEEHPPVDLAVVAEAMNDMGVLPFGELNDKYREQLAKRLVQNGWRKEKK